MTINQLSQFSSIFMKVGGYSSTFLGYPDPVYFKGSEKGSEHPDPNVQTRNSSNEKNQKVNLYNLVFFLILFIFWGIFVCPVFLGRIRIRSFSNRFHIHDIGVADSDPIGSGICSRVFNFNRLRHLAS